jgi:uncharacterized protein (DUF58 family)
VLKTRSLVFLLSDFRDSGFRRDLTALSRRHDVVCFHLNDPGERVLPDAGILEVRDPETGDVGILDLGDPGVRESLTANATRRIDEVSRTFRRAGCDALQLRTDRAYAAELATFFARRARARLR